MTLSEIRNHIKHSERVKDFLYRLYDVLLDGERTIGEQSGNCPGVAETYELIQASLEAVKERLEEQMDADTTMHKKAIESLA